MKRTTASTCNGCPLGEGIVDFKAIIAKAKEICPPIAVFNKPITGRPPQLLAIYDPEFMKKWNDMRAKDLARFIALAKQGHPYEKHMVIEDIPGTIAPPLAAALQFQQRDHMERGLAYARKVLALGIKN